jgi:para-aminobenzoate synthetase component 1
MLKSGFEQINSLTQAGIPYLCIIDFDKSEPLVFPLDRIDASLLLYNINGNSNIQNKKSHTTLSHWDKYPVSSDRYRQAFDRVQHHLHYGDSFLLNLTFPTRVDTNLSLEQIFDISQAKYKLWLKDRFITFSPEPFITIEQGVIASFPMKGTIRISAPDAESIILNDQKEMEEHLTIVDLIRNDLAMIARDIKVDAYRYTETVKTSQSDLLQVSSKISGRILPEYWPNLGDLLQKILPAGSISGAPKKKTIEIIKQVEGYQRGYFTGIVGLFDGQRFDSGVMIRFMEQISGGLIYKSGGGITVNSNWESEYQEMIDKVYVPII